MASKMKCTHEKHHTYGTGLERLTRTVCCDEDAEGKALVEICDYCKTFIITITDYRNNVTVLEVEQK